MLVSFSVLELYPTKEVGKINDSTMFLSASFFVLVFVASYLFFAEFIKRAKTGRWIVCSVLGLIGRPSNNGKIGLSSSPKRFLLIFLSVGVVSVLASCRPQLFLLQYALIGILLGSLYGISVFGGYIIKYGRPKVWD